MSNKIYRYFPNWMEMNDEDYVAVEFNTKEELVNIDWVKRWSASSGFLNYEIRNFFLVAIMTEATWIIGRIQYPELIKDEVNNA